MTVTKVIKENVHQITEVNVVDLEGFVFGAPWHEWAVEIAVVIVAHIIYEGAGLEPVS
jgi:hypothetical protein